MADPNNLRALAQALMQQQAGNGPRYRAPVPGAYGPMGAGMDSTAAEYNGQQDEIPGLYGPDPELEGDFRYVEPSPGEEDAEQARAEEVMRQGNPADFRYVEPSPGERERMAQEPEEDWTDTGMQQRFGVDPYGNPLPGMQQAPAPGSAEENAQYGYPEQGDAYDNPRNPNYWLNNLKVKGR